MKSILSRIRKLERDKDFKRMDNGGKSITYINTRKRSERYTFTRKHVVLSVLIPAFQRNPSDELRNKIINILLYKFKLRVKA